MARPKSDEKRSAIMDAATRVIVSQGLSAPTATIAKEAGISNGSLFTYFETKADLFNQLYLELKTGMAAAILEEFPAKAELRKQAFHTWLNWTQWATANQDKRRALTQLNVSDLVTSETRSAAQKMMGGLGEMVEQMRAGGAMKNAPMSFVGALMSSLAETTMDFMLSDPARAKQHCKTGFEAFWRVMS